MRDIIDTIAKMKKLTDNDELVKKMERIEYSVLFTAPEAMYLRWSQLHAAMLEAIPSDPQEWTDQDIELCALFSGNRSEDIKQAIQDGG